MTAGGRCTGTLGPAAVSLLHCIKGDIGGNSLYVGATLCQKLLAVIVGSEVAGIEFLVRIWSDRDDVPPKASSFCISAVARGVTAA